MRLGVGHNFLFSGPYEQLRRDVRSGILGRIDQITITWNRFLPQSAFGPFDIWMLRDPRNIMLETGSHLVAHMLDLAGEPDEMEVRAAQRDRTADGPQLLSPLAGECSKGPGGDRLEVLLRAGFCRVQHSRARLAGRGHGGHRAQHLHARPLSACRSGL